MSPVFMFSGFDVTELPAIEEQITKLNGQVLKGRLFDIAATHLVSKQFHKTEKLLSAIASGKWVVTLSYIMASSEEEEWLPETEYEWTSKMEFEGSPEASLLKKFDAAGFVRSRMEKEKRGLFSDWKVMLCVEKNRSSIENILKSGGAVIKTPIQVTSISRVKELKKRVNTLVCEQPWPFSEAIVSEIERSGIQLVDLKYIENCIFNPETVSENMVVENIERPDALANVQNQEASELASFNADRLTSQVTSKRDRAKRKIELSKEDENERKVKQMKIALEPLKLEANKRFHHPLSSFEESDKSFSDEEVPVCDFSYWPAKKRVQQYLHANAKDFSYKLNSVADNNLDDLPFVLNENYDLLNSSTQALLLIEKLITTSFGSCHVLWPRKSEVVLNIFQEIIPSLQRSDVVGLLSLLSRATTKSVYVLEMLNVEKDQKDELLLAKQCFKLLQDDFDLFITQEADISGTLEIGSTDCPLIHNLFAQSEEDLVENLDRLIECLRSMIECRRLPLFGEAMSLFQMLAELLRLSTVTFTWPLPVTLLDCHTQIVQSISELKTPVQRKLIHSLVSLDWLKIPVLVESVSNILHTSLDYNKLDLSSIISICLLGQLKTYKKRPLKFSYSGETSLHRICRKNNFEEVEKYLKKYPDVDINIQDNAGVTALHDACLNGSLECVAMLLEFSNSSSSSIYPTLQLSGCRTTIMHEAASKNNETLMKMLIEQFGLFLLGVKNEKRETPIDLMSDSRVLASITNEDYLSQNSNLCCHHKFRSAKEADQYIFLVINILVSYLRTTKLTLFTEQMSQDELKEKFEQLFTREPTPKELSKLVEEISLLGVLKESISVFRRDVIQKFENELEPETQMALTGLNRLIQTD
ncbi:SMC5-SMC6 complex localization factor protein 1 [Halotydeus destructor]|nr:SMC5-SMC6 complex localization factor protein 1 [Halotydeus destructor]